MTAPFSAVVLAGGRSTRMGRTKATLEIGGVPLWRRQVEVLRSLGPKQLMISSGADWSPGEGSWQIVSDRVPGLGPLGGLQAAFDSMTTDWLLVLAVDMPGMTAEFLGRLAGRGQGKGAVPVLDGFYQGLASLYPRQLGRLVDQAVSTEDRSVQSLLALAVAEGLVESVPVADADRPLFLNVNRPGDL